MSAALVPRLETFDDGEPRIRDTDLATALGYADPRQIRTLIKRRRKQLEEFGIIFTVQINTGDRGRPAVEYWLTERQAYLLCTYAETEKADTVRLALVEAFYQFRHGIVVPAEDTRETRILTMQQLEITELLKPFETRLVRIEGSVDSLHGKSDRIEAKLDSLNGKLDEVVEDVRSRRKNLRECDKFTHMEYLATRRMGLCPCCQETVIVRNGVKTDELQFDHWYSRYQAGLTETWPVCRECNLNLKDPDFKKSRATAFSEYQYGMEAHMCPLFRGTRSGQWGKS